MDHNTRRGRPGVAGGGLLFALLAALVLGACSGSQVSGKSASPSATAAAASNQAPAHATWTTLASTPPDVANVTFAPSNPQIGFACTSVNQTQSSAQPKLYKTSDGGQHWQNISNVPAIQPPAGAGTFLVLTCRAFVAASDANDVFLQQIALNPSGAGFAVARALHRSRDGGATWGPALATLDRTDGFDQLAVVGARILARAHPSVFGGRGCSPSDPVPTASSVIYASDDGGQSWRDAGRSIEELGYSPMSFATMGSAIVMIASKVPATACGSTPASLWRSTDGGATWQKSAAPAPTSVISNVSFTAKSDGSGYFGVYVGGATGDSDTLNTLYFTADGGATWTPLPPLGAGSIGITDPSNTQIDVLTATPTGAVVALAYQYPQPGGPAGVFVIRPGDTHAAWTTYAPAIGAFGESAGEVAGGTLWLLDRSGNAPTLSYLPLP